MSQDRYWMYTNCYRKDNGNLTYEYMSGMLEFMDVAKNHSLANDIMGIRCPCRRCQNTNVLDRSEVELHLIANDFVDGYSTWIYHGENYAPQTYDEGYVVYDQGLGNSSTNVGFREKQYMHMVVDGLNLRTGETTFEVGGALMKNTPGLEKNQIDQSKHTTTCWSL
ncbi:hypothetical protein LIER_24282 [Lithospermum erythrorhizon]|uniref:Transposase-associated domain-containing protein n=1 Tax=Lithospermum erythrorhizon TaxID=34254 RepID=A0AAV3R2R5_LITER